MSDGTYKHGKYATSANREATARWKRQNVLKHRQRKKLLHAQRVAFMISLKLRLKCVDCGWQPGDEFEATALDFDHVDRDSKRADGVRANLSLVRLRAEIAKCVPRCARCHRIKTARENDWAHKGQRQTQSVDEQATLFDLDG